MKISDIKGRVSIRHRSVASVLAFLFLFAALYTAGVGFFLTVNSSVQSVGQASAAAAQAAQKASLEKLDVAARLNATGPNLILSINNTGGLSSTIIEVYVSCSSSCGGGVKQGQIVSNPRYLSSSPLQLSVSLPLTLPIGTSTKYLNTCPGGCDIAIKRSAFAYNLPGEVVVASVLTSAGNIFSAQYPPPPLQSTVHTVVISNSTLTQVQPSGGGPIIAVQMVASPPQTYTCNGCVVDTVFVFNYATNTTMTGVTVTLDPPALTGTAKLTLWSPCAPSPQNIPPNSSATFTCTFSADTGSVGGFASFSGTATGFLLGVPVTSAESNSNPIQIGGLANVAGQGAFTGNFFVLKYSSCVQNLAGNYNFYSNGQAATLVLGQSVFTKGSANQGGSVQSNTLSTPFGVTFDALGDLWVADYANNRVLEYASPLAFSNGEGASLVIGQAAFTTSAAPSPPTAASLHGPTAIAFDGSGNLWVVDSGNNRVLEYNKPFSNGEAASIVLGQSSFVVGTPNTGGLGASSLNNPHGIALDLSGNLWVSDFGNNRILEYLGPAFSTHQAASVVLGQPNFSSGTANQGMANPSSNTLSGPWGITFDARGDLWAADSANNRVLEYVPSFSNNQASSLVLGQSSFTSGTSNAGGLSASSLSLPAGVALDPAGNLWVLDANNNRALEYIPPLYNDEAASTVIGQATFTTNGNSLKATGLNTAGGPGGGLTFDVYGNLWVADSGYNRVLLYQKALSDFAGPCTTNVSPVSFNILPSASLLSGGGNFYTAFYIQVTNSFNVTLPILQYSYIFGENSIAGEDFVYLAGVNGTAQAPAQGSWVNGVYYPGYSGTPSFDQYPNNCNVVNANNIPTNHKCIYANPGQTITLTYAACGYGSGNWGWGSHKDVDGYDAQSGCIPYPPCLVFDSQVGGDARGDCRSPIGGLPAGMSMAIVVSYAYKGGIYTQVLPFQGQFLLRSTTTRMSCSPLAISVGVPTTCTVQVLDTDGGKVLTPTGNVTFSASPGGQGTFSAASCTLDASGVCQVTFTPSISQGTIVISASYLGDEAHAASGPDSQTINVVFLTTTTTLTTVTTTLTTTRTTTSTAVTTTVSTTTASTQTTTSTVTTTSTSTSRTTTTTSGTSTVLTTSTQTTSTTSSATASTTTTSTITTTLTTSRSTTTSTTISTVTTTVTATSSTTTTRTTTSTIQTSTSTTTVSTTTTTTTVTSTTTTTTTTTRPK